MKLTISILLLAGSAVGAEPAERRVYFGDLHVHTSLSFDAFAEGTRTTPEDAYRYARGEAIEHRSGRTLKIGVPLDFMAVTDHAEYYGIFPQALDPESPIAKHPKASVIAGDDHDAAVAALTQLAIESASKGENGQMAPDPILHNERIMRATWDRTVGYADKHYEPGTFTTFAGFEWSSTPTMTSSLHRNVIFRDTASLPDRPYSSIDSNRPEDLWAWMEARRSEGMTLLAIPHNANMSGGHMFALHDSYGDPIDRAYAEIRARNEPIVEVVQIKGQSMIHPVFAPDEAFAETGVFNFTYGPWPARDPGPGSYVRPALGRGLMLHDRLGVNPYQFGIVGSTDSHNSNSPVEEDAYSDPDDVQAVVDGKLTGIRAMKTVQRSSGGLAAVWADSNTREGIYDALVRKEAYATTGPRIRLRFFGGWDLDAASLTDDAAVARAYAAGVPMGQMLPQRGDASAPAFLVHASREPDGANLDRIQIVKGWIDAGGETHERVYDVVWSGDRARDAETGSVPAVGNTVDVGTARYANTIGAETLWGRWSDPDFDAAQRAFYYVRVLQIPTPRWTTYDAVRLGVNPPDGVPASIQERAWSSAIWYGPAGDADKGL